MNAAYRPIDAAQLEYDNEGTPYSINYGDVYHPTAGAMGQARHVFLTGCGLPEGWRGQEDYVVVETGFGLGHNFIALWEAWRADPQRSKRLHFISFEKHPFNSEALGEVHRKSGAPPDLSRKLRAQWPLPMPGFHTLHFEEGQLTLTLLFGDALELLPELRAQADAIFLDGFAPGKNPDLWSPVLLRGLASIAHSNTRIATWSVSGWVRTGLAEAGFLTDKLPGFGGKREMLSGRASTTATRKARPRDRRAIVVGAGLAGSSIAERLAARDWQVQLIDSAGQPAQGASGNISGAFRPLPSAEDGRIFQLTRSGFLYGLRHLKALQAEELGVRWNGCGVLHLARDAEQEEKLRAVVAALRAPEAFVRWVDAAEAAKIAGHVTAFGGWHFPLGGWINPPSLCMANIARHAGQITNVFGHRVARLQRVANLWRAVGDGGEILGEAPHIILANAVDAQRLSLADWLPVRAARGQVSHLPSGSTPELQAVVCGQGYVTPSVDGFVSAGATFFADDETVHLRLGDHLENLDKANKMLPGFAPDYPTHKLGGRVGQRPVSPDRVPMVGEMPSVASAKEFDLNTMPRHAGLHVITGFGARGLVWGSLLGEFLAARINHDAPPLPQSLAERIDPARFLIRRVRSVPVPEI